MRPTFESNRTGPEHAAYLWTVSPYATYGTSLAVGTHYGPTRIHWADYSPCHGRDGGAGFTILFHHGYLILGPQLEPQDQQQISTHDQRIQRNIPLNCTNKQLVQT